MRVQASSLLLFCFCSSFCYVESISITIFTAISLAIYASEHLCICTYMYMHRLTDAYIAKEIALDITETHNSANFQFSNHREKCWSEVNSRRGGGDTHTHTPTNTSVIIHSLLLIYIHIFIFTYLHLYL